MKKIKLLVIALLLGICLTMPMFLTGCDATNYSRVKAFIHEDYHDKFDNMEFTIEDFQIENAKDISYRYYMDTFIDDREDIVTAKWISIKLKIAGRWHAEQAISHLETLEFVEFTSFHYSGVHPGYLYDKENGFTGEVIANPRLSSVRAEAKVSIESVTKEIFDTATIKSV